MSEQPHRVTFCCPLPPPECSANARPHWAAKARAVAQYRRDVALCVMEACGGPMNVPHFERARIDLSFTFLRAGRHDGDNLWALVKALQDGIVDAGLLPDDDLVHLTPGHITAGKGPRGGVQVTVTEETTNAT